VYEPSAFYWRCHFYLEPLNDTISYRTKDGQEPNEDFRHEPDADTVHVELFPAETLDEFMARVALPLKQGLATMVPWHLSSAAMRKLAEVA
jgi:hypothetical protein